MSQSWVGDEYLRVEGLVMSLRITGLNIWVDNNKI